MKKTIMSVMVAVAVIFASLEAQETKIVNGYKVFKGERPEVDLSRVSAKDYEPNKIMIKLVPEMERFVKDDRILTKTKDGYVKTGVQAIDELNAKFKAEQYKPALYGLYDISPASVKYRDRHKAWGFHLWMTINIGDGADVIQAVKEYQNLSEVDVAEPVYKKVVYGINEKAGSQPKWTPNDPRYAEQWHYNNTGQESGTPDCDIDLPEAWEIEKGNSDIIVAVIDQGVQFDHPDLAANMWSTIGPDGTSTVVGDHGTHVAGTIAAVNNNATGVSGIAGGSGSGDGVRIMSISLFDPIAVTTVLGMMTYAADNGAIITQNSWGYGSAGMYQQNEIDGIDYFNTNGGGSAMNGGVTIFAAGNDNNDGQWWPGYYTGAMAVASTNNSDVKSYFSNYGSWIEISAPGGETNSVNARGVLSSTSGGNYAFYQGTSMACPHVSGAAALIVSNAFRNGVVLNNTDLWNLLINNTDSIETLNPTFVGKLGTGRLNVHRSLTALQNQFINTGGTFALNLSSLSFGNVTLGSTLVKTFTINNSHASETLTGTITTPDGYRVAAASKELVKGDRNALNYAVGPNSTKTFNVTFEPLTGQIYSGSIVISSSDTAHVTQNIAVTGTGLAPEIDISVPSISASALPGTSATKNFRITNSGAGELNYSASIN